MFKERLRELRTKNKLTQAELAEILHFQNTAISKYEIGDRTPDQKILIKLADFFDVSVDYLLGISNIENPYKEKGYDKTDEFIAEFKNKAKARNLKFDESLIDDILDLYEFVEKKR